MALAEILLCLIEQAGRAAYRWVVLLLGVGGWDGKETEGKMTNES